MVLGVVLLSPLWLKEVVTVIAQEGSTMVVRVQAKRVGGRLMICPSLLVKEARKVLEIKCSQVLYLPYCIRVYAKPTLSLSALRILLNLVVGHESKQAVEW